ncbi:serine hydrolase domain-containing protein [Streptomyces marincola]|uniref:serine hydrolase domain-containing protein n=1 Tax=Streptomyces marincola TaxID=2878388 RepID=UPI001CF0D57E|nr:serine hydrolase domain-containing protein [Streptomyces marincola]UCM89682.1 beta-lactamase family protein [Streptomyces marincola]
MGIAVLIAGPVAAGGAAAAPGGTAGDRLRHDAEAITATGVTGVQARVTGADGRVHTATAGVADLRTGRQVPPDGHFRIGSTNKTLVAAVVLQLASEGALSLDDSVAEWLPGVVGGEHDGDRITLRALLQHTGGVYDGAYPSRGGSAAHYYASRYDVHTPEEIVAAAMRHEPAFEPGARWGYSNTGYVLLGMVIERATGRPWHAEVRDRVLEPLRMWDTYWPGRSPSLPLPHARGYTRFAPGEDLVDTTRLIDADASGGYVSTTADLDRFARALFDGTLLDEEALAELTHTVPVEEEGNPWPDAGYGLGLFSRPLPCGGTAWIPSGDQIGWKTRVGVSADGRRSVVVSMSTQLQDSAESALRQEAAATALIDNALCAEED